MRTLIKYEFLKLYKKKMNLIIFWGTCAIMVIFAMMNALQTPAYDEKGNKLEGFTAIAYQKKVISGLQGPLTDERVSELIKEFCEMKGNPDNIEQGQDGWLFTEPVYYSYYYPKREVLFMIAHNYDKPWENTYGGNIEELTGNEVSMYEARTNRLKEMLLQGSSDWKYSEAEQEFWLSKNNGINSPFSYGYAEGWEQVLDMMGFFAIPLISLFIMTAGVYAGEYESHADHIILTIQYGKSKIIAAKNIAAYLFGGLFITATTLIMYLGILLCNGFEGGNLVIQNFNVDSPYPFTYIQAILICTGVNYVMAFGMLAITLFVSARMKNSLPVLAVMLFFFLLGLFLSSSVTNGVYNHILYLLPYNVATFTELGSLTSYRLGRLVLDCISMRYVVYILLMVLVLPFAGNAFRKHQVQ